MCHSILGHYNIVNTQPLVSKGNIHVIVPGSGTCNIPIRRACVTGKAKKVGFKSATHTPNKSHTNILKKDDLKPGDQVSTDQYEFIVKGRLPYTKVKEDPHKMLCGGTLFVDHASSYVKIFNQLSLGDADKVRSKETYEHESVELGISIKQYHGDNGVYKSQLLMDDLDKRHQTVSMSGVGAHEKNGVSERAVQTLVGSARKMILHQTLLWSAHFDMRLWPFALEHAAYLWNNLPDRKFLVVAGIAPIEI